MALLELKNVTKHFTLSRGVFGQHQLLVKAVEGVDLTVNSKENLSIVGESGSGKTTLARLIIRLYEATSGSIYWQNEEISQLSNKEFRLFRKDIQMVFQDPYSSLDPRWTIYNILKEPVCLNPRFFASTKDLEKRMKELVEAVGLKEDILNRYPHEFSGGERQRIAIARALMLNPRLLILDEAVSSLDVIIQLQILNLLKDLQKKFDVTYIFISHNLRVVRKVSQRIAVMYKGRIVEMASTEEIFRNPLHPYTQDLLTAATEYRSAKKAGDVLINPQAQLIEKQPNHFVLEG